MAGFSRIRRCSHVKVTGHFCGSPALRGQELCYFHARVIRRLSNRLDQAISPIALLENKEAIQVSIMTVVDEILKGTIELKRAQLILRAISIAERNARRTRFESNPDEMVRVLPEIPADQALEQAEALRSRPCHSSRSEAQPRAVEAPAPDPAKPAGEPKVPVSARPAYSEHELQTMRQREARRARSYNNAQAETNRALRELERSVEGAQNGSVKDLRTVLQVAGILDENGHL